MKWKNLLLPLLTLMVSNPLSAWTYNPAVGCNVPCAAACFSCKPSAYCDEEDNPCAYTNRCNRSCLNATVYGDYLYWTVRRCELDYVWPNSGELVAAGKSRAIDPDYDNGFRVGLRTQCGCWDIGARYTYYQTDESDSIIDTNGYIQPSRLHPAGNTPQLVKLQFAKSEYDLDYDVIDIEFGRECQFNYCNCCTCVRFFGGVKIAFIDQELFTLYSDLGDSGKTDEASVKEKVEMDGYGLYAGTEAHWNLCRCLGVFGRVSGGALVADFDRSVLEKTERVDDYTVRVLVDAKDDCHKLITNFEIGAGLELIWDTQNCGNWSIQVGYEFHHWNNMLDFIQFTGNDDSGEFPATTDRHSEDLGLDGIVARLSVSF